MNNKGYIMLLGGAVAAVVVFLNSAINFIPSFLVPFVIVLYGLFIIYMTR